MNFAVLIPMAIVGLIVVAILMKVLSEHFVGVMVSMILAAIGIIIASFAMPHVERGEELNYNWLTVQGLFIFLYCAMSCAGFAFDEEEYVETEGQTVFSDNKAESHYTSKLKSKTLFWSCLGGSIAAGAILVTLNYMIFDTHAIALGVIGCIALAMPAYFLLKYFLNTHKRKKRHYY